MTGAQPVRQQAWWWLVLMTVMTLVVVGGVLAVRQLTSPAPPPPTVSTPPSTSSTPTPVLPPPTASSPPSPVDPRVTRPAAGPLLPGIGTGDVFVQTATAIYRVELATGQVTRTSTPELTQFSSFVAGRGWVVFKTVDNDTGVVVRNGKPAVPLPPALRPNGRVYLTPDDDLWLLPEDSTAGARVATRVDINGRRVGPDTIRLDDELGPSGSDLAGYLMTTNTGGFYQVAPSGVHRLGTGQLLAVGPRQILSWDCDERARCNAYLLQRTTGRRTVLPKLHVPLLNLARGTSLDDASAYDGTLSPDGRTAALALPGSQTSQPWPLAVIDLATGRTMVLPGSITDSNSNAQYAWTANSRYLLAITDHQLRAYDTETNSTQDLSIITGDLLHLTPAGRSNN